VENSEVYNRLDKGREPNNLLPRSELNPLTNPVLGKNLGRWAQAYFTSPPEKRERAVSQLLRELENEVPAAAATATTSLRITEDVGTEPPARAVQVPSDVLCPACQHRNQHNQRFCGSCGFPLQAVESAEGYSSEEHFSEDPAPHHSATAHPEMTVHPENDVQWLRDKALASLKESDTPTSHGWKYLVACGAVLALGFAYLQWASQSPRPRPSAPVATAPAMNPAEPQLQAAQPTTPARTRPEPAETAAALPKNPIIQSTLATRENINKRPVEASLGSSASGPSTESRSGPPPRANVEAGGGAQELLVAQHYLAGKAGPRDTTEAGKWLWKAVAKQNGTATLLLADLYMRGDGVPKSCDQARLLLVAAAKKGVPEAAQALRNLESSGCQ
jgi:TPR repeat protein